MTDFNLVHNYLGEGQSVCCDTANMDELQLAALLGKTLLEQNTELDSKLRKLQEFAEETLVLNQSLTRQLAESRDSLQLSYKTCEHLESKVDDLEEHCTSLQKQFQSRGLTIEHKSGQIQVLEDEAVELRAQNEELREQNVHLIAKANEAKGSKVTEAKQTSNGLTAITTQEPDPVVELNAQLQRLTFQKEKAERHRAQVLLENEALLRGLEKAELEIDDLTQKLANCEEVPDTPTTPHPIPASELEPVESIDTSEEKSITNRLSLFSELDTEMSSLKHHYSTLVEGCTCSASLYHKPQSLTQEVGVATPPKTIDRPFKELFEEMFKTLKKSAQVADRLIERQSHEH